MYSVDKNLPHRDYILYNAGNEEEALNSGKNGSLITKAADIENGMATMII